MAGARAASFSAEIVLKILPAAISHDIHFETSGAFGCGVVVDRSRYFMVE